MAAILSTGPKSVPPTPHGHTHAQGNWYWKGGRPVWGRSRHSDESTHSNDSAVNVFRP